jgi:hypothetical protein
MIRLGSIHRVQEILKGRQTDLPEKPGVYAFWWVGQKSELLSANRRICLKGPGGQSVNVEYRDWWPKEVTYPCLYVGKSTDIRKRFSQHILRNKRERLHKTNSNFEKAKPYNSSCQLRFGIEHIFPKNNDPMGIILASVGFSWSTDFADNAIAERFFEEDLLVGYLRPWFNIDSER